MSNPWGFCGDCEFAATDEYDNIRCRRHAPPFQEVDGDTWCGDFKQDDDKASE